MADSWASPELEFGEVLTAEGESIAPHKYLFSATSSNFCSLIIFFGIKYVSKSTILKQQQSIQNKILNQTFLLRRLFLKELFPFPLSTLYFLLTHSNPASLHESTDTDTVFITEPVTVIVLH